MTSKKSIRNMSMKSGTTFSKYFKNKYYILSRKSVGIDDVVSFPENRVVANEFVVDIEECLRTFRPSS